jgi:hypothetical protein
MGMEEEVNVNVHQKLVVVGKLLAVPSAAQFDRAHWRNPVQT